MADKIPVKAIFTGSDVTALGEYATGDTVPVAFGGLGSTGITGIVKGSGSAYSAATAGTDYLAPGAIGVTVQAYDGDLSAIAGLVGTSGYLKKTAADTWELDTSTFLTSGGALGTPTSGTLTNCTGLPISSGVSGLGANVATFLATPSSANLASAVSDETGSGALVFGTNPTITNYTETTYSANSSTAITLSLANGTMQLITLTGSPTITMPTAAAGKSFTLILYTGTGSYTVSWSTVAWAGGATPTVTTTASKKDIFNFYSDGVTWFGAIFGQAF